MFLKIIHFVMFLFIGGASLFAQITGRITDELGEPLTGAVLFDEEHHTGVSTDGDGNFTMHFPHEHDITLLITYLGYQNDTITVPYSVHPVSLGNIILVENRSVLPEIHILDENSKHETSLNAQNLQQSFFEKNNKGTFATALEKLPGISAINVGVGIAKPVIRGLSSNRIIVNSYGIKQESQQWGTDHGLEIDPYDVERVEIVKGPSTIQYGSDGLGGVINIKSGLIPETNTFSGSLASHFKTNNDHISTTGKFSLNKNNFFLSSRYSYQSFGDYTIPADRFVYNGFVLPILNNQLKNTAGRENTLTLSGGYKGKHAITRITWSRYHLNAGIFAGATGIPRSYSLQDDGDRRNIGIPKQEVTHQRLSINQSFETDQGHIILNFGFQDNLRKEFSRPEFHNIPVSLLNVNDELALQLHLRTYTFNAHYEKEWASTKMNVGVDVQQQTNQRNGFEYLLPDFQTFRSGVFILSEKNLNNKLTINGGLRLDYGYNDNDFYRQYVWDSNENIIDSLVTQSESSPFYNWSAALGMHKNFKGDSYLKVNVARSFRIPHPVETSSNGIHHGTFRHEQGTPGLKPETGYQSDISFSKKTKKWTFDISTFFNYFNNYIYLGPTFPARFSNLPEAGQIFRYRQDDAIYTGFEAEWSYRPHKNWYLLQNIDFVQSINPVTNTALPFTPQPNLNTSFFLDFKKVFSWLEEVEWNLEHRYFMASEGQWRTDRAEKATPQTHLWNMGLRMGLKGGKTPVTLDFQVNNLFNTVYLNHLSRYRLLDIPEQGFNFIAGVKIGFQGRL
jgi:iron complex outermembrane recepter protein